MSGLTPFYITAFDKGFINNKKPFLIADEAWTTLENAYCFREKLIKRQGLQILGRLRRILTTLSEPNTDGGNYTVADLLSTLRATEPNAEIQPGTVTFRIDPGAGDQTIYTDPSANGVLVLQSGPYTITSGFVNYETGQLTLNFSVAPGAGITTNVDLSYFPSLPVMGIQIREVAPLNDEQTIWWDMKYAYIRNMGLFQEFITGTTWAGTNSDFFWAYNYRGVNPQDKLFFVTNFVNDAEDPIRYTDGSTWTTFNPFITQATPPNPATDIKLYQARLIVVYYNRLLVLNTWEGTDAGGYAGAANYQNRCRFSARFFSPVGLTAWRTDIFGLGGAIDAPTNEAIIGVMFVKNTLIVQFEETTWQLTYIGEYGIPFFWERVSADYGSDSTFSTVLYENQMLSVGDKAIIASNAIGSERIDLEIPEQIFNVQSANGGPSRIWGVRDYERELIFWNYPDVDTAASLNPLTQLIFPNKVLVYNYRNNTWAIFRDSVTALGTYQLEDNDKVTWDSLTILWDDPNVLWGDPEFDTNFPSIVSGNQQGFVHAYGYVLPDDPSLTVEAIDLTVSPIVITSVNHNLQPDEIIVLSGLLFLNNSTFLPISTNLNGGLYKVTILTKDTFSISQWNFTTNAYQTSWLPAVTPNSSIALYVGGGQIALRPKLNVQSKDINIFQDKGLLTKLSYIDFLMEPYPQGAITINLLVNAAPGNPSAVVGNAIGGNTNLSIDPTPPFYTQESDYAWFRFFGGVSAQFFRIGMTYNDALMNTALTHSSEFALYAITAYVRPGGRSLFA